MDPCRRSDVQIGQRVALVLKPDQRTGRLTYGTVTAILTPSAHHPRGIKVRIHTGQVGRVQEIEPQGANL